MNRILKALETLCLALVLVMLVPLLARAQVTPDWVSATPQTYGDMIALDKENNAYVAGSVPWSSMLITKYSPTGTQLWQRSFDNPGTRQQSSWITVDGAGNAIVTGYIVTGSDNTPNGLIVLKYSPAGVLLWQDIIASPFGAALRTTTDSTDNVYVLGLAWLTNASGNTTHDIVTIKYGPNGARQWLRNFGLDSRSSDVPASMALMPNGNVVVVGGASGTMLMVAYDPLGNQIFSKSVVASTGATDVAVGPAGESYVVGGTYSSTTGNVFLVIKHDANFNEIWRKTYDVGQYGRRVAVDSGGNAIVTGVSGTYLDWMTIKLDPAGNLLWSRRYDQHQANDEIPYFMVVGPDNSVYITGQGGPGPVPGQSVLGDVSALRTVTVRYKPDGTQAWAATSFDSVRGLGVKLGTDNSVFVVGESPLTVFHYKETGTLNQAPIAMAAATTPTFGQQPLVVGFSSTGSTDPDGAIVRYQWDFGDGTTSLDANPTHSYAAGRYSAALTVTDNLGGASTSAPITITSGPLLPTPTSLTFSSSSVVGGRSVTATVSVSGAAGAVVALASSNSTVATVPSSIQIPVGSTSATFNVQTSRVRASTSVTITAIANGVSTSNALIIVRK